MSQWFSANGMNVCQDRGCKRNVEEALRTARLGWFIKTGAVNAM